MVPLVPSGGAHAGAGDLQGIFQRITPQKVDRHSPLEKKGATPAAASPFSGTRWAHKPSCVANQRPQVPGSGGDFRPWMGLTRGNRVFLLLFLLCASLTGAPPCMRWFLSLFLTVHFCALACSGRCEELRATHIRCCARYLMLCLLGAFFLWPVPFLGLPRHTLAIVQCTGRPVKRNAACRKRMA